MDKIFSTRIDEAVIKRIGLLSQKLNISKKALIEQAIIQLMQIMVKRTIFSPP